MNLFILFLLVVQSYAACPEGQFYLVDFKESGNCETHISNDACTGIKGSNAFQMQTAVHYMQTYYSPYYHQVPRSHSLLSYYSPGCQVVTYKGVHGGNGLDDILYGKPDDGWSGSCANTFYMDNAPCSQSGCIAYYNQGGTNCLCAPPGEDDAICVSECPAGTARRHGDDVSWDPCDAIAGCTNIHANNYNPEANKDDGSCEYCDIENGDFFLVKAQTSGQPCDIGGLNCEKLSNYRLENSPMVIPHSAAKTYPRNCIAPTPGYVGGNYLAQIMYNDYTLWSSEISAINSDSDILYPECGVNPEMIPPVCDCSSYTCYSDDGMACAGEGGEIIRSIIYPYDISCLCLPDGETEMQCVSECPEVPLYNIEKVKRGRVNPDGTSWDICTVETEGCPNPLFEEYDPSHTAHAPYLLTADDGSKYVNPIACHTLTCTRLHTIYDDYCLPEGQC